MAINSLEMTSNNLQKGGSIRIIFFFLAFVAVAVYTPILIDDLIPQEQTVQQKIIQGEDPTVVLEATGAGEMPVAGKCNTKDFVYGKSSDGYLFMRRLNGNQYAVDVVGIIRHFMFDSKGLITRELSMQTNPGKIDRKLANMLNVCKKSGLTPRSIEIGLDGF